MSVWKCIGTRCAGEYCVNKVVHDAVVVGFWCWPGRMDVAVELLCLVGQRTARTKDQQHAEAAASGRFWSRYEQLHEPIVGDEMSAAIEGFLHQLAHYAAHMPQLLARRAA